MRSAKSSSDPEVVIVGSGLSGAAVADTLRRRGISSVILEAGAIPYALAGQRFESMAEYRDFVRPCWEVNETNWNYEADRNVFDWIRVRAAGGRSLRWRGWLAKPQLENFTLASGPRGRWPFAPAEMDALYSRAFRWLNATSSALNSRFIDLADRCNEQVCPKIAAASLDRIRPLCSIDRLAEEPRYRGRAGRIVLRDRVTVTRVMCAGNKTEGVEYCELITGKTRHIRASVVVLAASPIETTRLLLLSDLERQTDAWALIGKNYLDHIAASYLAILPDRPMESSGAGLLQRSATMPLAGRNRAFREAYGGFTIELNGPNPASFYESEILSAAGLDPFEDRHVACIGVNAIGELLRSPKRSVSLAEGRDGLLRPMPNISIGWEDSDLILAQKMESEAELIATILAGKGGRAMKVRKTLTLGGTGTSHEAGTCPIGLADRDSVTDLDGRVHGIDGLYIADASLFPTALDCHPTLTVVALALNTADGITRRMRMGG